MILYRTTGLSAPSNIRNLNHDGALKIRKTVELGVHTERRNGTHDNSEQLNNSNLARLISKASCTHGTTLGRHPSEIFKENIMCVALITVHIGTVMEYGQLDEICRDSKSLRSRHFEHRTEVARKGLRNQWQPTEDNILDRIRKFIINT